MTSTDVRVVILEDEKLFRDLLGRFLTDQPHLHVVSTHDTAEGLLGLLPATKPNVAILDLVLSDSDTQKGINGFLVGCQIRKMLPTCGIVLLSNHADPSIISRLPDADASGWAYLLKRRVDRVDTLLAAITAVARGDIMIDPTLIGSSVDLPTQSVLTPHQMRVLSLLATGSSNAAIAEKLGVSAKSVEHAIGGALKRLGISSQDPTVNARVAAAMAYLRLAAGPLQ